MKLTYSNGTTSISDDFIKSFKGDRDKFLKWAKESHKNIPEDLLSDAFDSVSPPKVKKEKKGEQ
ncbi:hypothetical protein [Dysgonomonas macrotermitis]|uniref:Uncharacterized protein n=1 Tax=Dysgonomonas macrotermitis TaxID=1346286 RepID=A0A1M5C5C0_9BACT|nr:hypothetical protein [Dysgonomonas macrotermitis]SHF49963.1 hypothetical protein SAMN05444362_10737 [Dysgonomonas macrotermitis]